MGEVSATPNPNGTLMVSEQDAHEPFTEPSGYERTGWVLAGADGLSASTLAMFRAASLSLDAGTRNPRAPTGESQPSFLQPNQTDR